MEMGKKNTAVLVITVVNHILDFVETSTFKSADEAAAFASFCLAHEEMKVRLLGVKTRTEIKGEGCIVNLYAINDEKDECPVISVYSTLLNNEASNAECA
jgi:hypothetical protein